MKIHEKLFLQKLLLSLVLSGIGPSIRYNFLSVSSISRSRVPRYQYSIIIRARPILGNQMYSDVLRCTQQTADGRQQQIQHNQGL